LVLSLLGLFVPDGRRHAPSSSADQGFSLSLEAQEVKSDLFWPQSTVIAGST
jgi:hypothetical protein